MCFEPLLGEGLDQCMFFSDQLCCHEQSFLEMGRTSERLHVGDKFVSNTIACEVQEIVAGVSAVRLIDCAQIFNDFVFPSFHHGVDKDESRSDGPFESNAGDTCRSGSAEQVMQCCFNLVVCCSSRCDPGCMIVECDLAKKAVTIFSPLGFVAAIRDIFQRSIRIGCLGRCFGRGERPAVGDAIDTKVFGEFNDEGFVEITF